MGSRGRICFAWRSARFTLFRRSVGEAAWLLGIPCPQHPRLGAALLSWAVPVTVRLLTNIGRLWTGSEVWSNAAILTQDDRIAWVGPASELPASIPGVIHDIVDVDHVENLGGALVTPGLIDAHTHPVYAGNRWAELAMRSGGSSSSEIVAAAAASPRPSPLPGAPTRGPCAAASASGCAPGCSAARPRSRRRRLPPDQGWRASRCPAAEVAGEGTGHAARARHLHGRERRAAGVLRPAQRLRRRGRQLVL